MISELKFSGLGGQRSCERPLFMPEEFAFHEALGNRGAIHDDEVSMSARASLMDQFCDQVFPCSGLTLNKNCCLVVLRHFYDELGDLLNCGTVSNEANLRSAQQMFVFPIRILSTDFNILDRPVHGQKELR